MMYWTYAQIKAKVQKDMGIEQEEFVEEDELLAYCNEAIDEAESNIHTIYEDYFLTNAQIDLVQGTNVYSLPTDIYASKIRKVLFDDGMGLYYAIDRLKKNDMFEDIQITNKLSSDQFYRYLLINRDALTGYQLMLVPTARTSITGGITVWYIRNANRLAVDTDICDIPEFVSFVIQYMKMRIYEKEGDSRFQAAYQMVEQQRQQMVSTLSNMVDDGDTELEKDMTFYTDTV